MKLLEATYYGNSVYSWIWALAVAVVVLVGLRVLQHVIGSRIRRFADRTETDLDDLVADIIGKTRFFFLLVVAVWAGSGMVTLPDNLDKMLKLVGIVVLFFQLTAWSGGLISFIVKRYLRFEMGDGAATAGLATAFTFLGKLALWSVLLILALDNLGVNVTGLVASLGVGGIAVALAAQNILGDLFASLSIMLDRPFLVGDFIIVGDQAGTVERIGMKTTRVRSLWGEQLVFSNTDLLSTRIRNFKRMEQRRIVFSFGVIYQTPHEKLQQIPALLREIIEAERDVRFDRAHFKAYGDSSLNFEVVYWVLSPDYNVYMDRQQSINLALFRRFAEEGIEFAYPTRTLFLSGEESETERLAQSGKVSD